MVVETVNMAAVRPPLVRQRRDAGRNSAYGRTGARREALRRAEVRERERAYPRAASDSLVESNRAFASTFLLRLLLCRTTSRRAVTCEKCRSR